MGHIRTRNGLFLTMIWGISKYYIVRNAFILYDLTFLYISFAKIFCQNNVKKNCKFMSRVFVKNAVDRR